VLKESSATTLMGLEKEMKQVAEDITRVGDSISVSSGCQLFIRFLTKAFIDMPNFEECKRAMIERGELFLRNTVESRNFIAGLAVPFIPDGGNVLTIGWSRVVHTVLTAAAARNKRFNVVCTVSNPGSTGRITAERLRPHNIPVRLIEDSAVGHVMEEIDIVLVGAEAVAENGGVINKIGTYGASIVAKAYHKPFYVAAESCKFSRLFPLSQKDIPMFALRAAEYTKTVKTGFQRRASVDNVGSQKNANDYTPPSYITLLFTDMGVLTPSAIADELIKLYY